MTASTWAWFNGELVPRETGAPSVASINFHLGTSVFDGMMAYWNKDHYYIHRAHDHLERFRLGAQRLGLSFDWSVEIMLGGIRELLSREPAETQYVRPIAYRRGPELWVTGAEGRPVDVTIFTVPSRRDIDLPLTCQVSEVERISSRSIPGQTKVSGAYVNSFTARRQAELAGFQEALMLDRHGRIAEASAANLFFISNDRLITPNLNEDVFPGITRQIVMEIAREVGVEPVESDLYLDDLDHIEGAFLCSTLMEIRPLSVLGERRLVTAELPLYHTLLQKFREVTHQ